MQNPQIQNAVFSVVVIKATGTYFYHQVLKSLAEHALLVGKSL
jgi:hypothetical protein